MAVVGHLGFLSWKFTCRYGSQNQYASSCQISCQSVKPCWRYGRFSIFQDGICPPFWIFRNTKFHLRANISHHAKFGADQSNFSEDMAILRFFKMAAVRHLGFLKVKNVTYRAGFECQHEPSCQILCWSVKPLWRYNHFSIFKDGGRLPAWIVKSLKFYLLGWFRGPICVIMPNVVPIGQTVTKIWPFFDNSKMLAIHHRGLYHCAKFGGNRCSNFNNMPLFNILCIMFENAYSCPQNGGFDPKKAYPCAEPWLLTSFASKSVRASWL